MSSRRDRESESFEWWITATIENLIYRSKFFWSIAPLFIYVVNASTRFCRDDVDEWEIGIERRVRPGRGRSFFAGKKLERNSQREERPLYAGNAAIVTYGWIGIHCSRAPIVRDAAD